MLEGGERGVGVMLGVLAQAAGWCCTLTSWVGWSMPHSAVPWIYFVQGFSWINEPKYRTAEEDRKGWEVRTGEWDPILPDGGFFLKKETVRSWKCASSRDAPKCGETGRLECGCPSLSSFCPAEHRCSPRQRLRLQCAYESNFQTKMEMNRRISCQENEFFSGTH